MPGGGVLAVDFAIAFVGEHQKAEALRKTAELFEIAAIGHGALRVRGRGEIAGDGALEQRLVERVEIGQEAVGARGRQIDRLAAGGERAGGVSCIERIGDEHRRLAGTGLDPALGGDGGEEQTLARAVEHEHFGFGVDRARQLVAAAEPGCDRAAERLDALVGRVATEVCKMLADHRPDEGRDRMLRLPDRKIDDRLARLDAGDQLRKAHEGRAGIDRRSSGKGRFALGGRHGHANRASFEARDTADRHNR